MKRKISFSRWLKIAEELTQKGIKWHEHYFTPNCIYNKENRFVAVLENEKNGEIFIAKAKKHKKEDLKKLEKLVFRSVHIFR